MPALDGIRTAIAAVDVALVDLIARRVQLAREVGEVKRAAGLPITDPQREAAVVREACAHARRAGLPEDDIRALYWQLLALSRRAQVGPGQSSVTGDRLR